MPQQQAPTEICLNAVLRLWGESQESVTCVLIGDCMAPRLKPGMELVICLGTKRLSRGDIVMVRSPSGRLIQRIVQIVRHGRERLYLLKPDHRWEFHGPVAEDDILGTVVEVITPSERRHLTALSQRLITSKLLAWRSYASGRIYMPTNIGWHILAIPVRGWRRLRGRFLKNRPEDGETERH